MSWLSFVGGVLVLPVLSGLALLLLQLFSRPTRGMKCNTCDHPFAGWRDNFGHMGRTPGSELNRPFWVVGMCSTLWHDQVLMRTRKHRAAWTARYESLPPGSSLRETMAPYEKRNGVSR